MTTIPPMQPAWQPTRPAYNGRNRFGIWPIPGPAGTQTLVLAGERFTGGIGGSVDGRTLLMCPWPLGEQHATASAPCLFYGHQIVVYAESWDLGQTVRCDVFVDGYSLSTGEPISVIGNRAADVSKFRSRVTEWWKRASRKPSRADNLVTFVAIFEGVFFGHANSVAVVAVTLALVLGGDFAVFEAGKYGDQWVRIRGWSPIKTKAAEAFLIVGCVAAGALVFALGYVYAYRR